MSKYIYITGFTEIESFIVGMALGLAVLPDEVIADIKKITGLDEY